ncbi:putative methyltransferase [Actinacidiphila reveromycinica]|uniref:Putative methyltransferase n=1 Tax=Actinacidiphila reveromycinica TaxID=659352 RepID=A0A7U3VNX3_9ACTN|nr:acetylserotonin O-methyltransferase [Streptomyces sp. SN-593]BBA98083.1 putative methyltransferase [Streptomyces sp. SN-593]
MSNAERVLARMREYMVGPTRFMNLFACFELGIVEALRKESGLTAAELGATVGAKPDAVEQLLYLLVKEGFVAQDEATGRYTLAALADVADADLQRALTFMGMVRTGMLRQLYYLPESVRTGSVVGLKELYGFEGTMFEAAATVAEVRGAWGPLARNETASVYPWFFGSFDVPAGARVLDVQGGNGLGAIMTYQSKGPDLRVTTFDRPFLEAECLRNFEEQGLSEHCSFAGGDILESLPTGYDVMLLKHFVDMYDKDDVRTIFGNAHRALEPGGRIVVLAPVYPEDVADPGDYQADFFPAYILGCVMGRGGLQKASTYRRWLEESGFEVTGVTAKDPADIPADAIINRVVISAVKRG